MTTKNYCTGIGHAVANAEYDLLKNALCHPAAADCGRKLSEFAGETAELALQHRRMATFAEFLASHTPVVQSTTNKARVGHCLTYVYDDPAGRECEMKFVLGGAGEPELYREIHIFNYLAPFGSAFLGKEVADEIRVTLNGSPVAGELTAIELLPVPDALSPEVSRKLDLEDSALGLLAA